MNNLLQISLESLNTGILGNLQGKIIISIVNGTCKGMRTATCTNLESPGVER